MASKDFNSFMDSYIENIRDKKKNNFSIAKNKEEKTEERVPKDISTTSVYIIKKPKTFLEKIKEVFTTTDEESFEERKKEDVSNTLKQEQEFVQEYEEINCEEEKKGLFKWLKSIFSSDVNETYADLDIVSEEDVQKVINENSLTENSCDKEESKIYNKEKGFFAKIFSFFGISFEENNSYDENYLTKKDESKETAAMEEFIALKEDLKEVAIVATSAFKKLPKEQFKLFKESKDFSKFKTILKKHGIIREKQENTE
jgi:hypothetical protein